MKRNEYSKWQAQNFEKKKIQPPCCGSNFQLKEKVLKRLIRFFLNFGMVLEPIERFKLGQVAFF